MYVQPVPLSPNTSPLAIANGSTATAAIGLIVAMKVATSISRRKYRVDATYPTRRNIAITPNTLPFTDASPFGGALNSTIATPPKATSANSSAAGLRRSLKSHAPTGTMKNGASEPISAALATLLFVAPAKKMARFRPKKMPGTNA